MESKATSPAVFGKTKFQAALPAAVLLRGHQLPFFGRLPLDGATAITGGFAASDHFSVNAAMLFLRNKLKVLNAIVAAVAVFVMYYLPLGERPTQMRFHHNAVLVAPPIDAVYFRVQQNVSVR